MFLISTRNLFPLQDRHIPVHSRSGEPVLDHSQDYVLLSGHENKTHTIIRFRRKLDTCDEKYDVPITVSSCDQTLQVLLKPQQIYSDPFLKFHS